jgi:Chaperone of endosialidase
VFNTTGSGNTATGVQALFHNTTGLGNVAVGEGALFNNTGGANTALGTSAGGNATTGAGNVYIGANMVGVAGESNACYIASIFGQTSASGIPVLIGSDNRLGTATSSKRFKDGIKPMDKASEALLALKPVTFRYKKGIDQQGIPQFGLVAEDVEEVNPDLVVRDKEGKPYTVRYDAVNAMLLNEFLKEHRTVQEQGATITRQRKDFEAAIAQQQKQIEALTEGLQKVSTQVEASKPAPQTVLNSR